LDYSNPPKVASRFELRRISFCRLYNEHRERGTEYPEPLPVFEISMRKVLIWILPLFALAWSCAKDDAGTAERAKARLTLNILEEG
jgi:hypothetical protein